MRGTWLPGFSFFVGQVRLCVEGAFMYSGGGTGRTEVGDFPKLQFGVM